MLTIAIWIITREKVVLPEPTLNLEEINLSTCFMPEVVKLARIVISPLKKPDQFYRPLLNVLLLHRKFLAQMDFIKELHWRGMLQDYTPGVESVLGKPGICGYIGFDPTAESLTIGNYVQVMILTLFQQSGHKPIILMGGATGRVGDPSGRDKERELKTEEELDLNLARQVEQFKQLLNFESGYNRAEMVNNLDFYSSMNILDFLRDVGKTITVNYMLAKESVKNRIEKGISFTEFSYQLLQAYDFQCLFERKNCLIQMGGSDQWGNITAGTEFIRRNLGGKAYAITTPLLTKADGSKFGKSAEGNSWLDPKKTSPYQFYQFWINTDDRDISTYLRYFSLRTKDEIEALETKFQDDPRMLKKLLAEEITRRVHGDEQFEAVLKVSELIFNKKADRTFLESLNKSDWLAVAAEIPLRKASKELFNKGINIIDFLAENTQIVQSKGDARRAIKGNAISINKIKINDFNYLLDPSHLMHQRFVMIENGKKNKFVVEVT